MVICKWKKIICNLVAFCKIKLFILSFLSMLLFSFDFSIFHKDSKIYLYEETTEKKSLITTWKKDVKNKELIIDGTNKKEKISLILSKEYKLKSYTFINENEKTNFSIKQKGNKLLIEGISQGNKISKVIKISSPWIQQFGFCLSPFIMSNKKKINFVLINPKDFSLQKMKATKTTMAKTKMNKISYNVQNVKVSLQGFKSLFWSADLSYDTKTGTLLTYRANEGPNTPYTNIKLKDIK